MISPLVVSALPFKNNNNMPLAILRARWEIERTSAFNQRVGNLTFIAKVGPLLIIHEY